MTLKERLEKVPKRTILELYVLANNDSYKKILSEILGDYPM